MRATCLHGHNVRPAYPGAIRNGPWTTHWELRGVSAAVREGGFPAVVLRSCPVHTVLAPRQAAGMVNERLESVYTTEGKAVQVCFDLDDEQLFAVACVTEAVNVDRCRGVALDADAVLELRELVAIHDSALERAQDGYNGGTLVMTVARLGLLVQSLRTWCASRDQSALMGARDAIAAPVVDEMLDGLADLHARAVRVALAADAPTLSRG